MTLRDSTDATHSDLLIQTSDYMDPEVLPNDTVRGGPRLERLHLDFGLAVYAERAWYAASAGGNIALIPNIIVWTQTDQFQSVVADSAGFTTTRNTERILCDGVAGEDNGPHYMPSSTNEFFLRSVRYSVDIKSKARLAERSVGIAWRGFFDTTDPNIQGYTDWVRFSALISMP